MFRKNSGNEKERFACPFCYASCEFSKEETEYAHPKCTHCKTLLIHQKEPAEGSMKCLDCLMALEIPEGIWCIRFKGLASEEMAANCGDFLSKDILGDFYEG